MTWIDWVAVVTFLLMTGLYFGCLWRIGFLIIDHDRRRVK